MRIKLSHIHINYTLTTQKLANSNRFWGNDRQVSNQPTRNNIIHIVLSFDHQVISEINFPCKFLISKNSDFRYLETIGRKTLEMMANVQKHCLKNSDSGLLSEKIFRL